MSSNKIRAYISHTIRGKQGVGATNDERREASERAIVFGNALRKEFPNIDFYIPGEHHEIDTLAYRKGYMTEEQILDIDCEIILRCSFIIVFSPDDYISKGMKIEIDYAVENNIPVVVAVDGDYDSHFRKIVYGINCHLTSMMK
jgi:hypothetical protein